MSSDQSLGRELRLAIERQRHELNGQVDPRRLESGLVNLVAADQQSLLPALSYLLRSPLVARLLNQPAAMEGSQRETITAALRQDLHTLYAPALCHRLESVLAGLLGESRREVPPPTPAQPQNARPTTPVAAHGRSGAGPGLAVAVLAFLVGILGGALVLLWLQSQSQKPLPESRSSSPGTVAPAPEPARSPDAPNTPTPAPAPTDADGSEADATDNANGRAENAASDQAIASAITTVEKLYIALNARDDAGARNLFGAAAADQFDPAFFSQFSRITVGDLRVIASSGGEVKLEGLVTFSYPDGSSQVESRSFTVDSSSDPARIVASAFGQVIRPR